MKRKTIITSVDYTGKKTQKVKEVSDGQVKECFIEGGKKKTKRNRKINII